GIWSDEFEDLEFTAVEPGDSFSFEVYISVPAATPLGTIGETDIIVISEFDDEAFDWVTDFTIVNKAAETSFALSPGYTQQTSADTVLTYTHTITNTGALTDTYSLVVGNDQGWQVALAGGDWPQGTLLLPLTLAPQDKQTFTLHVTVPAGAEGVTAHTTLTATSQLAPGALQTVADTTIVTQSGYDIFLPLLLRIHGG
ncbi:MAG: hypothetical protein JW981_04715, partial [Anaerolineae bacterium]|nr:hypothetical protein [Anaerolineae bacterium]